MIEILHREFVYLWYYFSLQVEQLAGYWALGIVIGSVVSVFAKGKIHDVVALLGQKKWGMLGLIPASLLGIASPLCMYGTIPKCGSSDLKTPSRITA